MKRVRRKRRPNDLKETVHDRRARDVLDKLQLAQDEVDDPYEVGAKIVVLRSTRHDPLADMKSKGLIDQCDYVAGRHLQAAWENSEIGNVRGIDPGKEAVDGGRIHEVLTDTQRRGAQDVRTAKQVLGTAGYLLVCEILREGLSVSQVCVKRGMNTERHRRYFGERFRECLNTLAVRFGYATGYSVR